jgi:hypothetical protein
LSTFGRITQLISVERLPISTDEAGALPICDIAVATGIPIRFEPPLAARYPELRQVSKPHAWSIFGSAEQLVTIRIMAIVAAPSSILYQIRSAFACYFRPISCSLRPPSAAPRVVERGGVMKPTPLIPVHGQHNCVGHLIRTARVGPTIGRTARLGPTQPQTLPRGRF